MFNHISVLLEETIEGLSMWTVHLVVVDIVRKS